MQGCSATFIFTATNATIVVASEFSLSGIVIGIKLIFTYVKHACTKNINDLLYGAKK